MKAEQEEAALKWLLSQEPYITLIRYGSSIAVAFVVSNILREKLLFSTTATLFLTISVIWLWMELLDRTMSRLVAYLFTRESSDE